MGFAGMVVACRSILLVLLFSHVGQALVSEGELLMQFKAKIVDKRGRLNGWSGGDPCQPNTWTGIECSNDTNGVLRVSELALPSYRLSGTISTSLAGLTYMRTLDLTDNFFSGSILENISDLQDLVTLRLGDNQLSGSIPQLPPQLHVLELQNNFLSGDIGLTNLFNLSIFTLFLQGNHFSGRLPDNFNTTPLNEALEDLDLSQNQLGGSLPSGIGDILNLFTFDISGNNFTGEIPEGNWYYQTIDVSDNQLTGRIPSIFLRGKTYVNCSGNSLSGYIAHTNFSIRLSEFIDFSNNDFEGPVPLAIGDDMTVATILSLENNRFTGKLDSIFQSNMSNLQELRVGGNNLSVGRGLTSSFTNGTFNFPQLRVLNLSGSGVEGDLPSEVFRADNFLSLEDLDLSNNKLTGAIPRDLFQLPVLRELRLRNNRLAGSIDLEGNWRNLEVLDISNNFLEFDGFEIHTILENFRSLKELRLGSNNVNRTALPTKSERKLLFLEILDLSHCNLFGNVSAQYSRNDLLPSLKFLNLSNNFLEGSLPDGFGSMPYLIDLDVSNNWLSGKLPQFQFRLFNSTSFAGNEGLCGPPLQVCGKYSNSLQLWEILVIVSACVVVSGGSCLLLGWIWRRRIDAKIHEQDVELISALLDRDTTSLMSLRELRRATDDFSEKNQIGVGGFGTVYRGILDDGTEVAIKKSKRDASSSEDKHQFLNEVRILSQVHHRHLVRLLGCCLAHKNALLVFEFVKNGTLEEHLKNEKGTSPMSWARRLQIAVQTADALDYLHSSANPPIYHLDVKSANILLDDKMNAKVADFGISKLAPNVDATHITTLHAFQGTFGYMDPESVVSSMLTGKSDVYAFGVVMLELITAKPVVDRSRGENASLVQLTGSLMRCGRMEEIIDPTILTTFRTPNGTDSIIEVARLAERCLRFQSVLRPTMKEASKDLLSIQQQFEVSDRK